MRDAGHSVPPVAALALRPIAAAPKSDDDRRVSVPEPKHDL